MWGAFILKPPGVRKKISVEAKKLVEIYISMCIGLRTSGGLLIAVLNIRAPAIH
jgi:hypothetical protein